MVFLTDFTSLTLSAFASALVPVHVGTVAGEARIDLRIDERLAQRADGEIGLVRHDHPARRSLVWEPAEGHRPAGGAPLPISRRKSSRAFSRKLSTVARARSGSPSTRMTPRGCAISCANCSMKRCKSIGRWHRGLS